MRFRVGGVSPATQPPAHGARAVMLCIPLKHSSPEEGRGGSGLQGGVAWLAVPAAKQPCYSGSVPSCPLFLPHKPLHSASFGRFAAQREGWAHGGASEADLGPPCPPILLRLGDGGGPVRPQGLSQRLLSSGHVVVCMGQMACLAPPSAWHLYLTSSDRASFSSAKQHQTQQRKTKMLCHHADIWT